MVREVSYGKHPADLAYDGIYDFMTLSFLLPKVPTAFPASPGTCGRKSPALPAKPTNKGSHAPDLHQMDRTQRLKGVKMLGAVFLLIGGPLLIHLLTRTRLVHLSKVCGQLLHSWRSCMAIAMATV